MRNRTGRPRLAAWLLGLAWALGSVGCGGGMQEGVPSNINPNQPPPKVAEQLKAISQAEQARAGEKKRAGEAPIPPPQKAR